MTAPTIDEKTAPQTSHGDGSHDLFSHYVERDKIVESAVTGMPVMALCGKVWVPSRDPERYPICPECQRLYDLGAQGRKEEWDRRAREDSG
jgi:hypothetical protein